MRIIGLDLGQAQDPAAAAVVDREDKEPLGFIGPRNPDHGLRFKCRGLRTWRLGTDYNDIVSDVLDVAADNLVVDFGGVGRPVVDMLRKQAFARKYRGKIRPVQLIGSSGRASQKHEARGAHWNVPKIDVVTSIITAQQSGLLWLPASEDTKALLEQLRVFRLKFTKSANMQFGNAPGGHDDLVIALGLALWFGQKFGRLQPAIYIA